MDSIHTLCPSCSICFPTHLVPVLQVPFLEGTVLHRCGLVVFILCYLIDQRWYTNKGKETCEVGMECMSRQYPFKQHSNRGCVRSSTHQLTSPEQSICSSTRSGSVQFKQFSFFDFVPINDTHDLASPPEIFKVRANFLHHVFVTYSNHLNTPEISACVVFLWAPPTGHTWIHPSTQP